MNLAIGKCNKTFAGKEVTYYRLAALEEQGLTTLDILPYTIRIWLENLLRHYDGISISQSDIIVMCRYRQTKQEKKEMAFYPGRVIMQDFTGVPAITDLAVMREIMQAAGEDAKRINPVIPVDLIIDHSLQVDFSGSPAALTKNMEFEFLRNRERFALLKWAQQSFVNLRIFPPGTGIIHQINLETIATVVAERDQNGATVVFPDTLVGTDSHTTMINGLGVMGWGVGGIEAEAVMLGQPLFLSRPEVVGVRLSGVLHPGVTATDLVLTVTEQLRKKNVVEKFVEFFGPALTNLTIPDRATIANMAPEYGATMGYFPIDAQTIAYLQLTGRKRQAALTEWYAREQRLFVSPHDNPQYSEVIDINLADIEPSLAGPRRPQDRLSLTALPLALQKALAQAGHDRIRKVTCDLAGQNQVLQDGSIVIASITSCTNTSNPALMFGAGLLAKKACEKGLRIPPTVKTSFIPGSRTVEIYLKKAGLLTYLERMGFHIVGFGCATCIGNSGPLRPEIEQAIRENNLLTACVISGNRNFEARIHPLVRLNYLASPLLVIAMAITGRSDCDLTKEPLGTGKDGLPVYLHEIWPTASELAGAAASIMAETFSENSAGQWPGDESWQNLPAASVPVFPWDENSTYIRRVPFFDNFQITAPERADIINARALLVLGDSITTDHISPAGDINVQSPAGAYLQEYGVAKADFNTYGARRGNHEVMMRGTFANVRLRNKLVTPKEGGLTLHLPSGHEMSVYEAAVLYQQEKTPLIVFGGREYGTGSSRDWAAKGPYLLGVKAVIAESFERIHRSNLIGMGILPLQFLPGESFSTLNLKGTGYYSITGLQELKPGQIIAVEMIAGEKQSTFSARVRIDHEVELQYFRHGGLLPAMLRKMIKKPKGTLHILPTGK
jgi:aconitate hydratase